MKARNLIYFFLFACFLFSIQVYSQSVPQTVNYQGRLTDTSGMPLSSDTVPMHFALLDSDTAGASVLWGETQSSVKVTNGIYHVILGSVNPIPPSALSGATAFLEVKVRGEIFSPLQRLTSTPYARNSDLLDGMDSSEFALAGQGPYIRTVVVSPVPGDQTASGTALLNALAGISDASVSNRYLLKIEPGIYDLGTSSLVMKEWVDIEGSGERVTVITAAGNSSYDSGTVIGSNNAELRLLGVVNTGGESYAVAIFNSSASPKVTHVTAAASGASFAYGMCNYSGSSTYMLHVDLFAAGSSSSYGVRNNNSNPRMYYVYAEGGGAGTNRGVQNYSNSSPVMVNVIAKSSDGILNYGIQNDDSNPDMFNIMAEATGGNVTYGVENFNCSPTMNNLIATASGAALGNSAVYNNLANTTMINVTATATGTGSSDTYGVYNTNSSSAAIYSCTITATGGSSPSGIRNNGVSSTLEIDQSSISGASYGIYISGGAVRVGTSKLDGGISISSGTLTCVYVYDGSYNPYTCP